MCNALEQIIEKEAKNLANGHPVQVLFEDGIATIFKEQGMQQVVTLIEEIPYRVQGSIMQFKVK